MPLRSDITLASLNGRTGDNLPGWFGCRVVDVREGRLTMQLVIRPQFLAPMVICTPRLSSHWPTRRGYCNDRASARRRPGFTTIELKSNFLGTAIEGTLRGR